MERYSASRISAVVLSLGWILIALVGAPQAVEQDYALGWEVWLLLVFATLGPLVTTNVLWFRSLHRIGASRATLVANLQPFVAAVRARAPVRADDAVAGRRRGPDRGRDSGGAAATARARLRVNRLPRRDVGHISP